ncbi:MAG: TMEM175 family protein [Algoriphagus sp.]|nr:TMEM175 family protein [Algoriphagus sp.]
MNNIQTNTKRLAEASRTEAFSDAFFAIAITLLVLEFKLPEFEEGKLSESLFQMWPSLISFFFSFTYIGIIWLNHHALFNHIKYVDANVLWINLGVLFTTVLLAFPTGVLADAFRQGNETDKGVAVALYSISAGFMSVAWIPVFEYFKKHPELLEDHSSPEFFSTQRIRPWIGVAFYGLAAVIGQYMPLSGLFIFLLMVVYHAYTSEGNKLRKSKKKHPQATE